MSSNRQYVTFPADMQPSRVAEEILKALAEGYDARVEDIEVATKWLRKT